jgi:hypothetical protein
MAYFFMLCANLILWETRKHKKKGELVYWHSRSSYQPDFCFSLLFFFFFFTVQYSGRLVDSK